MRKVFLDELPKFIRGGKECVDWRNSVGREVKFIYDGIEGKVSIIDYNKGRITIKYLDYNEFEITTTHFTECRIGKLLMRKTGKFKININQLINDNGRNLIIIDREKRHVYDKNGKLKCYKYYKYYCNKCGNEDWIEECNLIKGQSCNACGISNKKVLQGYNDIYTTDRWMCDIGVSEEDARAYTRCSAKKIKVKCPNCGKTKNIQISQIYDCKSISCTCGDGFSYPEKFIISILNQLDVKYIHEYKPKWSRGKRYDFYLSNYDCIIECHGLQHYKYTGLKRTLQEEQNNDEFKKELALNNNTNKYIILDCRKSELEWIKNSILNSKLNTLFDLSNIDWLQCEEFALGNRVKEVCDYWNNKTDDVSISDVANLFNLNKVTIRKYLKQGKILNWCDYDPMEEQYKSRIKPRLNTRKSVAILKKQS